MSKKLSISVAIPVYNAEQHIATALRSIEEQTLAPDEIIVVDDGSTDLTANIIKQFTNVRLFVHEQNLGIAASRNTAWQNAGGDIIVYLDADASASPEFLEKISGSYDSPGIAGVGGRGLEVVQESRGDRWRREILYQEWGKSSKADVPFLFGMCSSYFKNILAELGGFDPLFQKSGEDMDFSFRVRKAGYRLTYNPAAVVHHHRADDSLSIEQMTYRHCLWGFIAQRKNNCFDNKASVIESGITFLKHLLIDGLWVRDWRYALLSLKLHGIICQAWLDARRFEFNAKPHDK